MGNEVKIIITTVDNASTALNKVATGIQNMIKEGSLASVAQFSKSLESIISPVQLAQKGFDFFRESIEKTVALGTQVEDLSRATGMNAEATSKLIQVADDLFVSYGSLTSAARIMARQGLVPNIETLARLSDQFLAIEDPAKRNAFAAQKIGRNWMEMTKILEAGGEKLRAMGEDVPEGLIFDEDELQSVKEYKQNLDALGDAWLDFQVRVGGGLFKLAGGLELLREALWKASPTGHAVEGTKAFAGGLRLVYNAIMKIGEERGGLVLVDDEITKTVKTFSRLQKAVSDSVMSYSNFIATSMKIQSSLQDEKYALGATGNAFDKLAADAQAAADAIEAAQLQEQLALEAVQFAVQGPVTEAWAGYTETIRDLQEEEAALTAEKEDALRRGWWPTSEKVQELNERLADNKTKQEEATDAIDAATKSMIYQQVAAGLDADAQLELARRMGLLSESDYNLAKALQAVNEKFNANNDQIITGQEAFGGYYSAIEDVTIAMADGVLTAEEYQAIIEKLNGLHSEVAVHTTYTETGAPPITGGGPSPAAGEGGIGPEGPIYNPTPTPEPPGPATPGGPTFGGGGTFIFNNYTAQAMAVAAAVVSRVQAERINAPMGG